MPSTKKNADTPLPEKFEEAMEELESIVTDMEEAELPLDQLIDKYGRGMKLASFCDGKLSQAEKRVEVLTADPAPPEASSDNPEKESDQPDEASLF